MSCKQTLVQVQGALYDRITRTCPCVNDEGLLFIVNRALGESERTVGVNPHDALVAAEKAINKLRTSARFVGCEECCLGCRKLETCEICKVLDKIQNAVDGISDGNFSHTTKPRRNCDKYLVLDEAKIAYKAETDALMGLEKRPLFEEWLYKKAK